MNGTPTNEERDAEVALLSQLLGDPSTWAEPSPGLEDAVMQAVLGAAPASAAPTTPRVTERRAARPRRWRGAASIAAAAAAIAAVLGTLAVTGSGTSADFTASLSAAPLAPTAHASADFKRNKAGFRVTLDATGLPRLAPSEYYQAWLKNPAGILVPIGTFSSSDGHVTLWSGVSPKLFPAISVTIEKTDGDQGSSGRKVLTGVVRAR